MPPQPARGGPRQRFQPTPRGVNMIVWSLDNRFVLAAIMGMTILMLPIVSASFWGQVVLGCLGLHFFYVALLTMVISKRYFHARDLLILAL